MKRLFTLFIIALLSTFYFVYAQSQSGGVIFSGNAELNGYISEVYVFDIPENYDASKVSICFGLKTKSSGKYYNYIRIGNESKGLSAYVELLSELYDTYDEAIAASRKYKGIIESKAGLLKCDFSEVPNGYSKSFVCNYYNVTNIDNSPDIKQYMQKNKMLIETTKVNTKALRSAINGKDTYQCEDQFADLSEVVIYRNGKKVKPENYSLFKQGKVQFNDGKKVVREQVSFEYNRNVKYYKPYSNDLSSNLSTFLKVQTECEGVKYQFVSDPAGLDRKVLMLSCDSLSKNEKKVRIQFSSRKYPLTYFKDQIKIFIPEDMRSAMLSYPKAITWFSIQGSWCQFGSKTGGTEQMYSGSASSLGISKPETNSKEIYFHLLCRRRHCNIHTGLEEYDALNDELSSFPIKAGEWIAIEREWKIGNPGICKHTIIDSDGEHVFSVDAYNCVCDPENEQERYREKYVGENPYNFCYPFICKIYTSKEFADYCIKKIGKCYLYYKDYIFLEGENVNAFDLQ